MPTSTSFNLNQKGFAHIFVVLLLLIGVGAGIYLVQNPAIFKPKADESTTCQASDPASFKTCLTKAQDESINQIEITKQIVCRSKEECGQGGLGFVLSKRTNPLTIFGTPNTGAGFKRIEKYDYPLLILGDFGRANDVSNITLKNLVFDETTTSCDFVAQGTAQCNSPLVLGPKLNNSTVDNVSILHAKNHGIQVGQATNLTIKNSLVFNSEGDGLWFEAAYPDSGCPIDFNNFQPCPVNESKISKYITLENNSFVDNKISAIEFYAYADEQNPSRIKGNFVIHNHRDSKYKACPPPNGHCPGGQVAITRSKSVVVEDNVIRDGIIDAIDPERGTTYHSQGLKSSGIELSDTLQNIVIKNNKIYNHTGTGIFADYVGARYGVESVNISNNIFFNNPIPFTGAGLTTLTGQYGFTIGSNYLSNSSAFQLPKALIFSDPPVCTSQATNGQCTSNIRWYSNDHSNLKITLQENPGSLFAQANNGSQNAPWISPSGATFQLVNIANNQPLVSTFAKSDAAISSPSPSASIAPSANPTASPSPSSAGRAKNYIYANPNPCTIAAGQNTCTAAISWGTTGDYPWNSYNYRVYVRETGGLFAQTGPTGSQNAPWVSTTPLNLDLYYQSGSNWLNSGMSVEIRGTTSISPSASPQTSRVLSASPNPCTISSGETCTSKISWNSNYPNLKITIKENPGSLFAQGANGSQNAPWIRTSGATFEAYNGNTLVDSLFVKGAGTASPISPTPSFTPSVIPLPSLTPPSPPNLPPLPSIRPGIVGDLDSDGDVDRNDLVIFTRDYWNQNLRSDFNRSRSVTIADYLILMRNYISR